MQKGNTRLLVALGAVAVLVAGLLVVLSQLGGGGASGGDLSGIPQDVTRLGKKDAPVTIRLYEDFQCPACAQFARETLPEVIDRHVRSGEVKIVSENIVFLGPDSLPAARAAVGAGDQDRYWQYAHLLFENQGTENSGYVTDEFLTDLATQTPGLDVKKWDEARNAPSSKEEVQAAQQSAADAGVQATPTLVVSGPGGQKKLQGAVPIGVVESAIKEVKG